MNNFKPLSRDQLLALVEKAKRTNQTRDQWEREAGFCAISDEEPWQQVRTALFAMEAGLIGGDFDAIAEGYAILDNLAIALAPEKHKDTLRKHGAGTLKAHSPTH